MSKQEHSKKAQAKPDGYVRGLGEVAEHKTSLVVQNFKFR